MAVTPATLLAPTGVVEASLFPREAPAALEARLQAYINEGVARAGAAGDDAVRAWANYRVFDAVYVRLTTQPGRVEFEDQGSHSYLLTQIENVQRLAHEYRRRFDELVGTDSVSTPARTTSTRADFTW